MAAVCGLIIAVALSAGCTSTPSSPAGDDTSTGMKTITDGMGRTVSVPVSPERVVCSGPGCLRYLTYMQGEDSVVGVDDIEIKDNIFTTWEEIKADSLLKIISMMHGRMPLQTHNSPPCR